MTQVLSVTQGTPGERSELVTTSTTPLPAIITELSGLLGLLRVTLLQTPGAGNHVCLPNTRRVRTRGGPGGGAGGGADSAAGQACVSGGGGAGGIFDALFRLVAGQTLAYVLGAPGVGVIGGPGTDGGNTTLTYNAQTFTGVGGLGRAVASSATNFVIIGCIDGSLASGPAAGGFIDAVAYYKGGMSSVGMRETAASGVGGNGGDSAEAPGGLGKQASLASNASGDGMPGQFSSGGGSAANFNNAPAAGNKGGDGGGPFLWVWEWGE